MVDDGLGVVAVAAVHDRMRSITAAVECKMFILARHCTHSISSLAAAQVALAPVMFMRLDVYGDRA